MRGTEIESMDRGFIHTKAGASIPYHRILSIADDGRIVFDKEEERRKKRGSAVDKPTGP